MGSSELNGAMGPNSILITADRSRLYRPGEKVNGYVTLKRIFEKDATVKVTVELEGQVTATESRSRGQYGRVSYETKITLFKRSKIVFIGAYGESETKEWPVEVELPTDCHEVTFPSNQIHGWGSTLKFDPGNSIQYLNPDPNQSLPPTMSSSTDYTPFVAGRGCRVTYHFGAKVEHENAPEPIQTCLVPLKIEPYRQQALEDKTSLSLETTGIDISIKSWYLDPNFENRSLSLKEKMKSTFSTKDVPQSKFRLNVKMPNVIERDSKLPILLSIGHNPDNPEKKVLPEVLLTKFKVIYMIETRQVVRQGKNHFSDKDFSGKIDEEILADSWEGKELLAGDLDLRELKGNPTLENENIRVCSSFKTFIISRQYQVRLEIEIECAREKEKISTKPQMIVILPPHDLASNKELMETSSPPTYTEDVEEVKPAGSLPLYEKTTRKDSD